MTTLATARAPDARAQQPPAAQTPDQQAAALKLEGDAAMDALNYDKAVAAYTKAYAASPDPALLYNRGRAHQALREWAEALADLEKFAHEASPELRARVPKLDELVADVRAHIATLVLKANVDGSRVLVRGTELGTTPLAGPAQVASGPARVEILHEGYFDWRQDVTLPGGQTTAIEAVLATKATSGILRVASTTAGARIRVDGGPASASPSEGIVSAGTHEVVVHAEGFDDVTKDVVVVAGATKDLTIEPEKRPALTSRWWFWTGIGVIVIAGVMTTYALLTERSADSGDHFMPGQVSGPLLRW